MLLMDALSEIEERIRLILTDYITDKDFQKSKDYDSIKSYYQALLVAKKCIEAQMDLACLIDDFETDEEDDTYANEENILELVKKCMQEPKTGHWIGHGEHCENLGVMPSGLGAYEWCSNCDCGIDVREWHRNNYNYCPNCGARMSGVEE